jgi:hypothetical protein
MDFTISYYSEAVQMDILGLPPSLLARYISLTDRMELHGPNLGEPHTQAFGEGLFELRLKGAEGIARVFYCTLVGRRIVMLSPPFPNWFKPDDLNLDFAGWIFFKRTRLKLASSSLF